MPLTTYGDQKVLDALNQATALGAPATWYFGLMVAPSWQASTAYTAGEYVIPTAFNSLTGSTGRLFVCTTAGTTGSTIPTGLNNGSTGAGGTVADGTVVWTEVTDLFAAGTFTGAEQASAGSYARASLASSTANWAAATSARPSASVTSAAITFATPTANWGQCVGYMKCDASTAGNVWEWGCFNTAITAGSGSSPSIPAGDLTLTLE